MDRAAATPIPRHFGLDWLRIGAFGLLVLYHAGMVFAPGPWIVKSSPPVEWAGWLMLAVQPWRMPLLFVVSGYASRALLTRSASLGRFAGFRSQRLLLPFLFGLVVVNPPQTWVRMTEGHGYRQSLLHFWTHDWLRFGTLDGIELPHAEHLWFVLYLWAYTMGLALLLAVLPHTGKDRAEQAFARLAGGYRLLVVPLAALLVVRIGLLFTVPEDHGLFDDWVGDALYVPAFLFGFGLAGSSALWPAIARMRRPAASVALAAYLVLLLVEMRYPGGVVSRPHAVQAAAREAAMAMAWCGILILLAAADRLLNRDHPWRKTLAEAVFPLYIVHQTAIVLTAWWLRDCGIPRVLLFMAIVFAALLAGWIFYRAGKRIRVLGPFAGLARPGTSG